MCTESGDTSCDVMYARQMEIMLWSISDAIREPHGREVFGHGGMHTMSLPVNVQVGDRS